MSPELIEPRRRDRGRDDSWIRAFLDRVVWGTVAVAAPDGPPHVNTNLFLRAEGPDRIYVHTARVGALVDVVAGAGAQGAPASFTAGVYGRLLPAPEALEFSIEYAAVSARGRVRAVADPSEAEDVLHRLLERYAPHLQRGRDYRPVVPEELRRTAVFCLDVSAWSGKQKAVDEHPGGFVPDDARVPFEV